MTQQKLEEILNKMIDSHSLDSPGIKNIDSLEIPSKFYDTFEDMVRTDGIWGTSVKMLVNHPDCTEGFRHACIEHKISMNVINKITENDIAFWIDIYFSMTTSEDEVNIFRKYLNRLIKENPDLNWAGIIKTHTHIFDHISEATEEMCEAAIKESPEYYFRIKNPSEKIKALAEQLCPGIKKRIEKTNKTEKGFYELLTQKDSPVSEYGWIKTGPITCDEFCIWVSHESFPVFMKKMIEIFGPDKFIAPGISAQIMDDTICIPLEYEFCDDVDIEKLFPKESNMHPCSVG